MLVLFEEGVLEHKRGNRYVHRKIAQIDNQIKGLKLIKKRLSEIVDPLITPDTCPLGKILNDLAPNTAIAVAGTPLIS